MQNLQLRGTLKSGSISLSNNFPTIFTTLVCDNRFVITKNGNKDGTTQVAHNFKPLVAAVKLVLENITKKNAIKTKINGRIFLLNDINRNFIIFTYL